MRPFQLVRREDLSGVSGTGLVAEGVAFSDGTVALRWLTGEHRSTGLHSSIRAVLAVHGHEGRTQIRWLDEPRRDPPERPPRSGTPITWPTGPERR